MAQKIRLVAYRNDISYPLDLLDNPNVSLNFKFSDIKNPASKQSSYSQTFKLPFTDNNNAFFQELFSIELQVFDFQVLFCEVKNH